MSPAVSGSGRDTFDNSQGFTGEQTDECHRLTPPPTSMRLLTPPASPIVKSSPLATKLDKLNEDIENVADVSLTARIVDSKAIQSVTFYVIEVIRDGQKWRIERRYNDFLQLNERIGAIATTLPEKGMFGVRKTLNIGGFRERRARGLNAYLVELTSSACECGSSMMYIDTFLGVSQHADPLGCSAASAQMLQNLALAADYSPPVPVSDAVTLL